MMEEKKVYETLNGYLEYSIKEQEEQIFFLSAGGRYLF